MEKEKNMRLSYSRGILYNRTYKPEMSCKRAVMADRMMRELAAAGGKERDDEEAKEGHLSGY